MQALKHAKVLAAAALMAPLMLTAAFAQDANSSFFVTSKGLGDGANLGGLEGADAHCATLAEAAGISGKTWRAYLSTQEKDKRGISARGPHWCRAMAQRQRGIDRQQSRRASHPAKPLQIHLRLMKTEIL